MEKELKEISEQLNVLMQNNKLIQEEVKKFKPVDEKFAYRKQNDDCTIQGCWIIAFLIAFFMLTQAMIAIFH